MDGVPAARTQANVILTPDQRVRVFVSSTMAELAEERTAVRRAIQNLHMSPVLFELGARAHPPRSLYSSYLEQSHVFLGMYWQRYGWVAPGMPISGLEDEYVLAGSKPKLIYVKEPAPAQEDRLTELLDRIRSSDEVSYKTFSTAQELERLVEDDITLLLSEAFLVTPATAPARRPRLVLPGEVSTFVGRNAELASVDALLARDDVRLVTLTGPGGVGKTRLALRVAASAASRFEDGVAFVGLASVRDPEEIPGAIATAVGLHDVGGASLRDTLRADLADRSLLLVLDNCEHLLGAVDLAADLLAAAPDMKALATSREALRISGEHEFAVPPLDAGDSVLLFEQRAASVRNGFVIDEQNASIVTVICNRLENVPLAIELAAAHVRLLPLPALLERLAGSLDFLVGGARDMPERQRTLRGTVQWSYDLLSDEERRLLATSSVFEGSFSLAAVEAVHGNAEGDILELLASLVDKSLLRADASAGEPRFRMLAMIREFAREQLEASGAGFDARERHAMFYRELGFVVGAGVRGPDQLHWLEIGGRGDEGENNNLRAALAWYLSQHRLDELADMMWALWVPTWVDGRLEEGRLLSRAALAATGSLSDQSRARLLLVAGLFDMWTGGYEDATGSLRDALDLANSMGDDEIVAYADVAAAMAVGPVEGADRAEALAGEGLDRCRRLGDQWGAAAALNVLCWLYVGQGRFAESVSLFEETLAAAHVVGDAHFEAMAEVNLAEYHLSRGELDEAERFLTVSAERYRSLRSKYSVAYLLDAAARPALARGDGRRAAMLLGAGDQVRESIGVDIGWNQLERRQALVEQVTAAIGGAALDQAVQAGRGLDFFAAFAVVGAP